MLRLLPIAPPATNERTLFMFGEAVQVLLAGLKNLPALVVSGTCGRLNSDHGKDSLLGASATVNPALLGPAPTKGLPPPNTHSKPLAAPLPGTLFWNPVAFAFAVYVPATGSNSQVRSITVFVESRPPAMYNLLLITPKPNPPAGCGNGIVPVRSVHVLVLGSYAHAVDCALVTCPVLYPLMI